MLLLCFQHCVKCEFDLYLKGEVTEAQEKKWLAQGLESSQRHSWTATWTHDILFTDKMLAESDWIRSHSLVSVAPTSS